VNGRMVLLGAVAAAAGFVAVEVGLLSRQTETEGWVVRADRAKTEMVYRLLFTDTAEAFKTGAMKGVSVAKDEPARVALDVPEQTWFPREGTWTSPQTRTDFPFTELLPSWNLSTPADTGVVFTVRVRDAASREWSPWLRIGGWGRTTNSARQDECDLGKIDVDTLKLNRPADAYQLRATLQSFDLSPKVNPSIRRIAVTYSGALNAQSAWAKAMHSQPVDWARDLKLPFFPQGDNDPAVVKMTCSPTSVSMVLSYFSVDRPTMENCLAIWDDHDDLFGNWANATQRAAEVGMDAWLQRFRNWDQVKELIARGQPVIASINFEKGTYEDAPIYKGTGGHLIVIRGFTADGKVIVNDPASRAKGNGALYPAKGLAHAWFGNGGVGYVIRPPAKPLPAALVKASARGRGATTVPTTAPVAVSRGR
jgi:hypothetical protein